MFKSLLSAVFALVFAGSALAAGPGQIWRLEITSAAEDIVEISEVQLRTTAGGANVTDLIRNYTFEETSAIGAVSWSVVHNLGIQSKFSDVTYVAYDVDVVAPGEWFQLSSTGALYLRGHLAYEEVEYTTTDIAPGAPEMGEVYFAPTAGEWNRWNGASWDLLAVTVTASLPQPNAITADTITLEASGALPAAGGPALNNEVTIAFPEAVVGAATVIGSSFDTTAVNRPGDALPPSELIPNRKSVVVFDNNLGSWFKSSRAPTERTPLALQYTYWVGDPARYPNVVEYAITARKEVTAPRSWQLYYWNDGQWNLVDQQAGIRFEDGETRVFAID